MTLYASLDHPQSCKALCYSKQSVQSKSLGMITFQSYNHRFKPFTDPDTKSIRSAETSTAAQSDKGSHQKGCEKVPFKCGKKVEVKLTMNVLVHFVSHLHCPDPSTVQRPTGS